MAHRKQLAQPRACAQCGTTFHTARKGHVHCSSACNTRAWRQRKPATEPLPLGSPAVEAAPTAPPEPSPVTLAFNGTNVGMLAVGTAMGNLLSAGVKQLFAPAARTLNLAAAQFPTWPPAELLAAAQAPQWVADPAWAGQLWLLPTLYHGHTLHLYAEAGLPYVLWQAPNGEWRLFTTPAELQQLAATRPVSAAMRALQQQYGLTLERSTLGSPLPRQEPSLQQLG
ncbi:hypothetical protein GO988_23490 [Hymenobacter sp. HMF4947]|uniref:Uncharacterized protein n=1 Tax=Hymenobacter ginkgonis TaxID=2682976 RepID=A0A7K1TLL1_9BACT|nr:hypothetical protein [Hymenobacter ginkgonis]MVN79307.1 hypothetical protein [Hymenobacter ginkgonis]